MFLSREAWRSVLPRIAFRGLIKCITIQGPHIVLIKFLLVLGLEIIADISKIEAHAYALRDEIHPIEVAHAIIVDHRGDSLLGNREGLPVDIAPIDLQARIADNVSDGGASAIPGPCEGHSRVHTWGNEKSLTH